MEVSYHSTMECVRASGQMTANAWLGVGQGLLQGCVLAPLLFNIFFNAVLVERSSANEDVVKDLVCTEVKDEKGGWQKRGRPEKGRDKPQETVAEPQPIWGMLYADDASIVSRSRNSHAKMIADIVAVCASIGLTVSEAKTETMCLMTKRVDRVTFVTEAAGQVYKQTAKFACLGATVCENADLTVEINRRVLLANPRFRRYGLPLYDQPTAPLRLKVQMLKAEVMETTLYGCVTWSPTVADLAILRKTHHRLVLGCIGWKRKHGDGYHVLSYAYALAKTGCENVETTVRKRGYFSWGSWPVYG